MTKTVQTFFKLDNLTKIAAMLAVALIFLLPYERIPSLDITLGGSSLTIRLSTIIGLGLIVVSVPALWEKRDRFRRMPLLGLALFWFVYLLATGLAADFSRAVVVFALTSFMLLVGISVSLTITPEVLKKMKTVLYWTTIIVLAFGFYQYFGDLLGWSSSVTGLRDIYTKVVFGFPRIQSTGLEPLYYANFLLIPFFVFSADFIRGNQERPILLTLIAVQISLAVSRGAYAGAIVGLVALVAMGWRARIRFIQIGALFLLILLGVIIALGLTAVDVGNQKKAEGTGEAKTEAIVSQATNFDTQDDRDRNRTLALNAFREKPLFGFGPGGFDTYARGHTTAYGNTPGRVIVNNEPLELLAEGGIMSIITLGLTLLWIALRSLVLLWRRDMDPIIWSWLAGLTCYLFALAIQYQTFSTLYIMHIWVVIGILIGIVTDIRHGKVRSAKKTKELNG